MKNGLLNVIGSYMEKRRLRRSFLASFIVGTGRDSFGYYENGRKVEINVEMMSGAFPRRIYRQNLKWNDNGEILAEPKQIEVLSKLCEYLDRLKIKWEFYSSRD